MNYGWHRVILSVISVWGKCRFLQGVMCVWEGVGGGGGWSGSELSVAPTIRDVTSRCTRQDAVCTSWTLSVCILIFWGTGCTRDLIS